VLKYVMVIVGCLLAVYFFANAIFAMRSPVEFLRARWTTTRGLRPDTPNNDVRFMSVILIIVGAFWAWFGIGLLLKILRG
jgi:hypothetical protein